MSVRRFLLLQGPISPFFRRLSARLRQEGHVTLTVTFNTGDALLAAGDANQVAYKGAPSEWAYYLRAIQMERSFTDVVVYNDCRFYHAEALKILGRMGVRAHVLEEGYFRPRRITYESVGVNGYSVFFPCSRGKLEDVLSACSVKTSAAKSADVAEGGGVQKTVRRIFMYAMMYYLAMSFTPIFYPYYQGHRRHHPLFEMVAWFFRWIAYPFNVRISAARQARLLREDRAYALLLLQLGEDSQIRVHSPFSEGGQRAILERVIGNFAECAPKDLTLVVKNHPLDCGLDQTKRMAKEAAKRHGVLDRMVFIDKGHLPTLLRHARMAVTVNSTAGTSALHHRTPLVCLGRAIYDCEGLTFQGDLSRFWTEAAPPDPVLVEKFRAAVCARTQIRGAFYTRSGVDRALADLFSYRPFSADPDAPDISDRSVALSGPEGD